MHECTVTTSRGKSQVTAVVVGHCAADLPRAVERAAAAVAKGSIKQQTWVDADDRRYLVIGVRDDAWLVGGESWRCLGADVVAAVRDQGYTSVTILAEGDAADLQALAEGCVLGDYRFLACRSGDAGKRRTVTVRVPGGKALATGVRVAEAQNAAREFADLPPNQLYPASFVKRTRKSLAGTGLRIKAVEGIEALRKARFPGLVTVGQGSARPPALLEIAYRPSKPRKSKTHFALVGKGITFDSGGISLKPGAGMWEMKMDMGGAATVFGAIKAIASLKPRVPVTAYIALAENMPDGRATRPGDIYQARNGKWINVDNTDAEGRLVLSDTLTYACERGATHLVDVATLTGAEVVALGTSVAAVMGRHDDFVHDVRVAGLERGEELWPMPLYGEYRALLDHPHADLNNIGGRWAGCLTAGIFLSEFVDPGVRWAHCDVAGPAMRTDGWRYYAKGGTAFGVRSLAHLATTLR